MRTLILANNDIGLYQFRKELIQELLKENEVVISLPYGELVEPLVEMGCRFIDTPMDRRGINPFTDLKLLNRYRKLLKIEKPDLVITYTVKPNVYGGMVCRMYGIPYAINITGLGTAFQGEGILKRIITQLYRIACKKAKVVFFENSANQQLLIDLKIVDDRQTCLLNGAGVNLEHYQVMEYPDDTNGVKFLFIGRVMKEKGIDELFAAMKMLVRDGIKCSLDVVGPYEEEYGTIIENYEKDGWLKYWGFQKDVRPFIKNSHCFILPSWHEGMANTNLECAASGRPVITSCINGCKEAVINDQSGFLVEVKNTKNLYDQMKRFCGLSIETQKQMGCNGRKHMEAIFDKRKVVEETIRELKIKN